ncbi:MAG: hypothetical protein QXI22_05165 [Sulfolobales archaeon]
MKDIVPSVGLPTQALGGDESSAPSHPGSKLDGSHMPFGSTAAHDPTGSEILRVEVEVPGWTMNKKMIGMNIQGQTVSQVWR